MPPNDQTRPMVPIQQRLKNGEDNPKPKKDCQPQVKAETSKAPSPWSKDIKSKQES